MDGRANAILAIDQRNFTSIWISRAQRKTFLALIPASVLFDQPSDSTHRSTPFFPVKKITDLREPRNVIPFLFCNHPGTIFERGCFVASIFL